MDMAATTERERARTRAQSGSAGRAASVNAQAPPGCRIYRAAVARAICEREAPALTARALEHGEAITSGQSDGRRVQVDLSVKHDTAASELHRVLKREHELVDRIPTEWRALNSQPGCKEQGMHFDYDPDLVEGRENAAVPEAKACVCVSSAAGWCAHDCVGSRAWEEGDGGALSW
jgi:hypothetical protein